MIDVHKAGGGKLIISKKNVNQAYFAFFYNYLIISF